MESLLHEDYNARKKEVKKYLRFLSAIYQPNVTIRTRVSKTINKQLYISNNEIRNILLANIYLLLYNLIESTINNCGQELERTFSKISIQKVTQLSEVFQECWIQHTANVEHEQKPIRLEGAKSLFQKLIKFDGSLEMKFDLSNKGTLTDKKIKEIFSKYNIILEMPKELKKVIFDTQIPHNGYGIIEAIKTKRCELAHGQKSFSECGSEINFSDAEKLSEITFAYLEFVIQKVTQFIENKEYFVKESEVDTSTNSNLAVD